MNCMPSSGVDSADLIKRMGDSTSLAEVKAMHGNERRAAVVPNLFLNSGKNKVA